ncbi:MAG TPA: hypothetical protein VK699_13935 [Terriglobales bacterium]|jgi:hypothetical protein|nr:hypothetical protein [Terriglobales bacterium]
MRTRHLAGVGAAALMLCYGILSHAQSLGEVARQQRQANTKNSHRASHVVTNEDITSKAESGDVAVASSAKEDSTPDTAKGKDTKAASASALQTKIKAQKQKIAALKAHLEELQRQLEDWNKAAWENSTISYVSPCAFQAYDKSAQEWCDTPKRLRAESEKTQTELEAEQKDLEQTQEEVRRMGYGNAFYDPES